MQTRTITVDYARPRGYDVGYRAENNFTLLALPIPAELEGADSYRVYFESTVGEHLQTELLTPTDGYVTVKITSDVVPEPGNMAAQLVAFADGEIVGYAPMITGSAKVSIPDGTERLSHSLAAEIALNTAARHSHANKGTLDKLSASNGKLQYNGSDVGLKGDKGADGANGKDGANGITPTIGANGNWYLDTTDTGKPSRGEKGDKGDPGSDANVTKANVITALGYTPEAVSAQVTTGSNIALADNTEYRLTDVTTLTLTYPTSNFECWMRLSFAESGDITVTLPTTTQYIGTTPDFKNGETWELSFKDKILAAQKVGEGT